MILLSTRMSYSGRSRPWGAWVYAEKKPLQVLGVPLVPPRCGIWAFFSTDKLLYKGTQSLELLKYFNRQWAKKIRLRLRAGVRWCRKAAEQGDSRLKSFMVKI